MAKEGIKAKNVVSFSTGEVTKAEDTAKKGVVKPRKVTKPVEEKTQLQQVDEALEKIEEAAKALEENSKPVELVKEVAEYADTSLEEAAVPAEMEVSEEVPARKAPEVDAPLETRPLNLRTNKYLDETPQDPDWTELHSEEEDLEEELSDDVSTFAEVFVPLHNDSTGTIVRKGMVIVSIIVIVCCLVALILAKVQVSAEVLTPDIPTLADTAFSGPAAVLQHLTAIL